MSNGDVHGFLLMSVSVGIVVSAAFVLPLIYTMAVRGWGLGSQAPWPATLAWIVWLMLVGGSALYLSSLCAHAFGIEGTSNAAQAARTFFILIWCGIGAISMFAAVVVIARRKQKRENAAGKRDQAVR